MMSATRQADGRKAIEDARATVAANTATPEQLDMAQRKADVVGWARTFAHVRPEVSRTSRGAARVLQCWQSRPPSGILNDLPALG